MRGRLPKPLEQHEIDGTLRPDRHGDAAEIAQASGAPVMPAAFTGEAKALWLSLVDGLIAAGIAKGADTAALVLLCEWWARYRKLADALDKLDPLADTYTYCKLTAQLNTASAAFSSVAARFGLTPADRMRLRVEGGPKKQGVIARQRG